MIYFECRFVYNLTVELFGQLRLEPCLYWCGSPSLYFRSSWESKRRTDKSQSKSDRILCTCVCPLLFCWPTKSAKKVGGTQTDDRQHMSRNCRQTPAISCRTDTDIMLLQSRQRQRNDRRAADATWAASTRLAASPSMKQLKRPARS